MVSGVVLSLRVSEVTLGALHAPLDSQVSDDGSVRLVMLARSIAELPLMNCSPSDSLRVVMRPSSRIIFRLSNFHNPTTLWLLPAITRAEGIV